MPIDFIHDCTLVCTNSCSKLVLAATPPAFLWAGLFSLQVHSRWESHRTPALLLCNRGWVWRQWALRHWGNIYKLYSLYSFLREGHNFVLYVLNGKATLCINCTHSSQGISKQTNAISSIYSSQTMLEGLCGFIMACNVFFLAGNSEVSLELQCFTTELITHIVCECNVPEWVAARERPGQTKPGSRLQTG